MFLYKRWALSAVLGVLCLTASGQERIMTLNSGKGGVEWKIKPVADVSPEPGIHTSGYNDHDWVKGVAPGTVFGAYVAAGLEQDPNYAVHIYKVDKAKYDRDFWYLATFPFARRKEGGTVYLCGVQNRNNIN
ncbi:hypothetical protein [Chitinophaga agri]|uniref:Uncharacterized protein n=1 Tax=Chitinophaga agri TaxID=2703787 RepID=A0A6B9Z8M4_9BACT|nr:hypothetical protein [Chitinophaga agri]QHS58219.1 hypothetical protein GWR21_01005 [Chitinophaga agri]